MLTYRSQHGNREVIRVDAELESNVMDIFMGYLDKVVTYAFGEEQTEDNRDRSGAKGLISANRPGSHNSIRQMERELAVDFLARRMAPPSRDQ